jgi:hypothetical protein
MADQQIDYAALAEQAKSGVDYAAMAAQARGDQAPTGGSTELELLRQIGQPGGIRPVMTEGELVNEPGFVDRLNERLRGPAHPTAVGDLLPALVPDVPRAVLSGARTIATSLKGTLAGGKLLNAPGRIIGRVIDRFNDPLTLSERTFRDAPLYQQMEALPLDAPPAPRPTMVTRPAAGKMLAQMEQGAAEVPGPLRSAEPPYSPPPAPSDPILAQLEKDVAAGRQPPSVLEGYKKAQARGGVREATTPTRGVLRVKSAPPFEPMASHAQTSRVEPPMMASHTPTADPMQAAIDAKRYEIGSQAMGREFQTGPAEAAPAREDSPDRRLTVTPRCSRGARRLGAI